MLQLVPPEAKTCREQKAHQTLLLVVADLIGHVNGDAEKYIPQKETASSLVGDAEAYRVTSETKAKIDTVLNNSVQP